MSRRSRFPRQSQRRLYRALRLRGATRHYVRKLLGMRPLGPQITKEEIDFLVMATTTRWPKPKVTALDRVTSPTLSFLMKAKRK